jgi:hypothetical protein
LTAGNTTGTNGAVITALLGTKTADGSVAVVATDMTTDELTAIAAKEIEVNAITGNMAVTSAITAGNLTTLFGKYTGTTGTVNATTMDAAQLGAVVSNLSDISVNGITGTMNITSALTDTQITSLLGSKTADAADVNVNLSGMTVAQINAVVSGIAKVDAVNNTDGGGGAVTLTVGQFTSLQSITNDLNDVINIVDTGAAIAAGSTVLAAQNAKIDTINANDNAINLTYAQYSTLNTNVLGKNADVQDAVAITATQTQDTINTANINGAMKVIYTLGTQTTTFEFDDVGDSGTLTNGDTWTAANLNSVDVLNFVGTDVLDLTAFALSSGERSSTAVFRGDTRTVDDQTFAMARGAYNAGNGVFTYDAAGAQLLVLWDSNDVGGTVVQSGVVLTGVTSLLAGTTILGS